MKRRPNRAVSFERPIKRWPIVTLNRVLTVARALRRLRPPISEQSLTEAAQRRTGLADFGDDSFRDPMRRLIQALEDEGNLDEFGWILARGQILLCLENRLRVQREWVSRPQILDGSIEPPLFILGLPRTGSTLLVNLLGRDPNHRFLANWEAMRPAPFRSTRGRDMRRKVAARHLRILDYLAPSLGAIHEMRIAGPEECVPLLANSFRGSQFFSAFHLPAYQCWLQAQDHAPAYEYHRRQLLLLQWQRPGNRWLLKAPAHLLFLDSLFRIFPRARVVQLHRDPFKVIPSVCSLNATVQSLGAKSVDLKALGPHWAATWAEALDRAIKVRERFAEAFCDVLYRDLMADPLHAVRLIYERFGYPLSDQLRGSMAVELARNPQHKRGIHRYSLATFGLEAREVERRFGRYVDVFRVPREPD